MKMSTAASDAVRGVGVSPTHRGRAWARRPRHEVIALLLAALLWICPVARGEFPTTRPYPAVTYVHETRADPPRNIFIAKIDLSDPNVAVKVAPAGPDPDGTGKWQTTLDETADIAEREGFEVAINGDFFSVEEVIDPATGKKRGYHEGQSALVIGPSMTDGRQWATSEKARPCLIITRDGVAVISQPKQLPAEARQVIAASHIILKEGKKPDLPDTPFSTTTHPRTAVGTADRGRKLILVVVDGRRPGVSVGMSLDELSDLILALGCDDAVNLDGGGSSTLVIRNPDTGDLQVMNQPSDGQQRPVANVVGVELRRGPPSGRPATAPTP